MFRIDSAGATQDNQFTEGDPSLGTPATVVSAAWLNAVQEELVKVITTAGIALDKAKTDQLLTGLQALFAAKAGSAAQVFAVAAAASAEHAVRLGQFTATKAAAGEFGLPGGVTVKWFLGNPSSGAGVNPDNEISLNWPTSFGTACLWGAAIPYQAGAGVPSDFLLAVTTGWTKDVIKVRAQYQSGTIVSAYHSTQQGRVLCIGVGY